MPIKKKEEKPLPTLEVIRTCVQKAINRLLYDAKSDYYGEMLQQFHIHVEPAFPTCGVWVTAGRMHLKVGGWFATLTPPEQVAILKHECLHPMLLHLSRFDKYGNQHLMNIACDLVINQMLEDLPHPGCFVDEMKLPAGKAEEWYYNTLLHRQDGKGGDNGTDGTPGGNGGNPGGNIIDISHGEWGNGSDNKDVVDQTIRETVRQARDTCQEKGHYGNLPGAVQEIIDQVLQPPKVNWKRIVRSFLNSSVAAHHNYSYSKTSRDENVRIPGKHREKDPAIVVIGDTSGSMGDVMELITPELQGIVNATSATVWFIQADAEVGAVKMFDESKRKVRNLEFGGGGGTDFEPALTYIAEHKLNPDGVIYITDGDGHFPDAKPRFPVLWVLTDGDREVPYGRKCLFDPEAK